MSACSSKFRKVVHSRFEVWAKLHNSFFCLLSRNAIAKNIKIDAYLPKLSEKDHVMGVQCSNDSQCRLCEPSKTTVLVEDKPEIGESGRNWGVVMTPTLQDTRVGLHSIGRSSYEYKDQDISGRSSLKPAEDGVIDDIAERLRVYVTHRLVYQLQQQQQHPSSYTRESHEKLIQLCNHWRSFIPVDEDWGTVDYKVYTIRRLGTVSSINMQQSIVSVAHRQIHRCYTTARFLSLKTYRFKLR